MDKAPTSSTGQPPPVPPKGHGCRADPTSMTAQLARLVVGEHVELPRKRERCVSSVSRRLGIHCVTRRLGSADTTTVYRIA